jgi:peptide/nickel transport system permease protein
MARYVVRRVLLLVPSIIIITFAVASLMRVVPGDPATLALGQQATEADRDAFRDKYDLNDPLPVAYAKWWGGVFQGDLGESVRSQTNVVAELKARLPTTLEMLVLAVLFTVIVGVPAGILAGVWRGSPFDYGVRLLSVGMLSVPSFWLGTLAILLPSIWWGYLPPIGGRVGLFEDPVANLQQFWLPSLILGIGASAGIIRIARSSVLDVSRTDYVRTAYAKGLRERVVIYRHMVRNALIPVITLIGLQIAALFGGAVIIEQIFSLRGVGLLFLSSISNRDYPMVQGVVLFLATVFLLTNLLIDLSYAYIDPRIRYS